MRRRVLLRVLAGAPLVIQVGGPAGLARAAGKTATPRQPPVLVIDPGHGGKDPGAIGPQGIMEKHVTLDIAQQLIEQLTKRGGVRCHLTREDDSFLPLAERVALAREAKADLFVSIHADSAPDSRIRGLSAYTLSTEASDDLAQAIAHQENLADGLGVDLSQTQPEVAAILLDLAARRTMQVALQAREAIVRGAARDLPMLDHPTRSANFAVLKAPDVPSVLVETGFLSNPRDAALLRDADVRRKVAGVLARDLGALLATAAFG
jgi:N-acetylmuramoyl-L-alanine amidase